MPDDKLYLLHDYAAQAGAEARMQRFDDMRDAFAAVMASDEKGELRASMRSKEEALYAAAGYVREAAAPQKQGGRISRADYLKKALSGQPVEG